MKEFINIENFCETLLNLYKGKAESLGFDLNDEIVGYCEERAEIDTEEIATDMNKYVHMSDTSIVGNFCDIREDWNEREFPFVDSEIETWGDFDDVIKSIDDDTISSEELRKFQTWCEDWFFTAYGTYNLKYNFGECLCSMFEYMINDEEEE